MKKIPIITLVIICLAIFIYDFFNMSYVYNFDFPANTYRNTFIIPKDYINLGDFLHENSEYLTTSGLSHEIGIIDKDGGLIAAFAYESKVLRKNYFTKEVYIKRETAINCLEFAKQIYSDRNRDYDITDHISKEGYETNFIFSILFSKSEYIEKDNKHFYVFGLNDFQYTYFAKDYLDKTEYTEFINNFIYLQDSEGNVYADYTYNTETKQFIFSIQADTKIVSIKLINPLFDYLLGEAFERTINLE